MNEITAEKSRTICSWRRAFAGLIALLLLTVVNESYGQEIQAIVGKDRIEIGEQFTYELRVEMPKNSVFTWPDPKADTINEFEILLRTDIDTVAKKTVWELSQTWTLTSFDSGFFVIPPLFLIWGTDTFTTDPVLIQVDLPEVLEDVPIYEIKDIQKAPFNWLPLLWWSMGLLLAAALIYLLIKYLKKKPVAIPIQKQAPEKPAEEEALQALRQLRKDALWQEERFKEHYDALTNVLKLYIKRRYGIPALEYTSDQLIVAIKAKGIDAGLSASFKTLLTASDMAKYAKGKTDMLTAETLISVVEEYVIATTPKQETPTRDV